MLRVSGAMAVSRRLRRRQLLILTYHGVMPAERIGPMPLNRNVIDTDAFRWQMQSIGASFTCVGLSSALASFRSGRPLPPRPVAVTFDDGFANNLEFAYPILRSLGIPSTLFLTTGHVGGGARPLWTEWLTLVVTRTSQTTLTLHGEGRERSWNLDDSGDRVRTAAELLREAKRLSADPRRQLLADLERQLGTPALSEDELRFRYRFLTWQEIGAADPGLVDWGSHTVNHEILSTVDDEKLRRELTDSKRAIEGCTGRPCELFSYPNGASGDFGPREERALSEMGYAGAVTQIPGFNTARSDPYALRRINIGRGLSPETFEALVSGVWHPLRRTIGGWA